VAVADMDLDCAIFVAAPRLMSADWAFACRRAQRSDTIQVFSEKSGWHDRKVGPKSDWRA